MRSNQTLRALSVLVISLGLPVVARAGGDADAGKVQSLACQACHVSEGSSDTPHLAGQRETYIAKQLKAFKAADRKNPVMNAITGALSETDIANLAAYWSGQPVGSDTTVSPEITAITRSKMVFPREFPKGFVLYGTTNKPQPHVVAKNYVNTLGLQAAKSGQPLPDGSVIIVVDYTPKLDAGGQPVADKDGSWIPDTIKYYEGMEARAGWGKDFPALLRNLDWNYAVFGLDKTPKTEINQAICLSCHTPAASTGYVFGFKKILAKAGAK